MTSEIASSTPRPVAQIELSVEEIIRIIGVGIREEITAKFRDLGFRFTTIELGGFKSGCMRIMLKGNKNE